MSMKRTAPVIVGIALGIVELGTVEGAVSGHTEPDGENRRV